jgi:hypothetical protein
MLRDCSVIYNKVRRLCVKLWGFIELKNYFSTVKSVDRVHNTVDQWAARTTSAVAVHRCAGTRGCWRSAVVVEEDEQDEAAREGCPPEHKRWQRGGAMTVKGGDGSSSTREWRKARESSVVRGNGAGCSGSGAHLL